MNMAEEKKFEHEGALIQAEMETTATPQQAWEAWADAEKIAQWFVDRAMGEAKPGGTMTWFFDYFGLELPYEVVDAVPGKLFVLKWNPPHGDKGILEVRIERHAGVTLVRLINSGFRDDAEWKDEYEGVVSGWKMSLAILKYYLENHFARKKTGSLVMRPASFRYEQLLPYFLEAPKLAKWFARSGAIGKPGDRVHLDLRDAGKLTGRALTITDREVTVSWEEIGGTLELKAFKAGPQRMVGLRTMSWKLDANEMKALESQLTKAVERLAALFPASAAAGN
jgi:uncharacterized protein YndB with AHSA1/START domain